MDLELNQWQQVQGYIVSGGGDVVRFAKPGVDFENSDLPHYHLTRKSDRKTFHAWHAANRRSYSIVGCWSRPIFAGAWKESSFHDTEAFNLQTPSLFIDMRFPIRRPHQLRRYSSLSQVPPAELRILARQHCFSGYSLPETMNSKSKDLELPVFTRHHIIDWNYHPLFPRNRPNRWWVEISPDSHSFKEHSAVRNPQTLLPVYFERWARIPPFARQTTKYLAMRKVGGQGSSRDAVLIIVGNHFALAVNRDPFASFPFLSETPPASAPSQAHVTKHCKGGGAMYVDYLLDESLHDKDSSSLESRLSIARAYLDLEGSYGFVNASDGDEAHRWAVARSTQPWREESRLFPVSDRFIYFSSSSSSPSSANSATPTQSSFLKILWLPGHEATEDSHSHRYGLWEVFESSFSQSELHTLFPPLEPNAAPVLLRSRL